MFSRTIALFVFSLFFLNKAFSQVTASDCPDAINACTNPNFIINPTGFGQVDEIGFSGTISNPSVNPASSNSGCLLAGELNSTWIIITCVTSGTLEFSIGDGSSPGCMDWIMYPYNSSACNAILNNTLAPIRCNWNGACLGFTGCASVVPTGASPFDFEPAVNAIAGDQFIVCFSNYSGQSNINVPIDFFGTAQVSCYTTVFICPGETIQLTGFAGAPGSTYNWTPTTGIIGSSTSQTISVSPTSTATYECITTQPNTTILDTVFQVSLHTPATLSVNMVLESCQGANDGSISVVPTGTGPFTYTIDGVAAPNGNFTSMGDGSYLIEVTDGNGCTTDTLVTLLPGPVCCIMTVSANYTATSCPGSCDGTATASYIDNNAPPTFEWFNEFGNPIGQTTQTATGLCAGNYTVEITDPGLCTLSALVTITEGTSINIDNTIVTDPLCDGECNGSIEIIAANADEFSIDNGVTFFSSGIFNNLCSGNYDLMVQNNLGCVGTASVLINNPVPVVANFTPTPEVTTIENTLVSFINYSLNQTTNLWDFGGLGVSNNLNPSFSFPSESPEAYNVCLTVLDNNNCADSVCHVITINDGLLYYVPNSFTPDGDGRNDLFIPVLNNFDPETYKMLIFNRWGELIFETESITAGWDGTNTKGSASEIVKDDVYIWKIEGNDKGSHRKIEIIGHVTLFK